MPARAQFDTDTRPSNDETESQLPPFLPLRREVARAQRVTEGENLLAVRKNGEKHALSSNSSLPQSWLALLANPAPSSEGANGKL